MGLNATTLQKNCLLDGGALFCRKSDSVSCCFKSFRCRCCGDSSEMRNFLGEFELLEICSCGFS